nr:acid sphingomyelinase phosphodiesterase 3b [Hymenolepis microstoma]
MEYPITSKSFALLLILASLQSEAHIHNGLFWHFSDVHVDLDYTNNNCKGPYGDLKCDSPLRLWISALNASLKMISTRPDFVIFSGDSVAHTTLTLEAFEATMETVASVLKATFPSNRKDSIPVILSLGNHDVFPDNRMSAEDGDPSRKSWCTRLGSSTKFWGDWIANETKADSSRFSDGCFYSRIIQIGNLTSIRIISLNGLIYARRNTLGNASLPDPLGQFTWLITQLKSARHQNQKVLIVMHFPIGAPENSPIVFRHLHDVYNARILEIFSEFADVISLGLFGHQHTDSYRVLEVQSADKAKKNTMVPLFFLPSISPLYLQNLGGFRPRIRIFNYSMNIPDTSLPPTLEIQDFHQFYANISTTSKTPWDLEYVATKAYNLSNLSGSSIKGLLDSFENDQELWCSYWNHELGIGMAHNSGPCPHLYSNRHCRHMCSLRHVHFPSLDECLSNCDKIEDSTVASPRMKSDDNWNVVPVIVLVIVAFVAILIGVVLLANRELCRRKNGSRGSRRRLDINERRSTYLIAYRQPALNGVTLRRSTVDEEGLVLGNGFQNDELKALNVEEEAEDGAYDADASGDEDEIPLKISSSPKEDFYSLNTSIENRSLLQSVKSIPLYSSQQAASQKNHDIFDIEDVDDKPYTTNVSV